MYPLPGGYIWVSTCSVGGRTFNGKTSFKGSQWIDDDCFDGGWAGFSKEDLDMGDEIQWTSATSGAVITVSRLEGGDFYVHYLGPEDRESQYALLALLACDQGFVDWAFPRIRELYDKLGAHPVAVDRLGGMILQDAMRDT
jgi:hypothetical protein